MSCQCFCNQNFCVIYLNAVSFHSGCQVKNVSLFCIQQQGSTIKNTEDFMSEASIMGQFRHPNVILLVGVVTISTYTFHVFVYSFVYGLLLFLLFVCLFVCFSQFICVINAWQERILSCTWTRSHISSLIFRDPCVNSLVFLRLLCHWILLAYSWKFNQLLKLTSFYLLKLIFACGLTRISVSKNAAITQLTRDLPNCQEYVMTSLVLWIHGFLFFFVFFCVLGIPRCRPEADKGRRYK